MGRASKFRSEAARAAYCALYDQAVAQAPVPVEQRTVDGRWGTTNVLVAGDPAKPALVALHGKSFSSTMWVPLLPSLTTARRVYLLDAPGDLNKSVATAVMSSPAKVASWVAETCDALSVDTAAVMGASLGAWMATQFAMAHPDRVERLALVGPAGLVSRQYTRWTVSAILTVGIRPKPARIEDFVDSMAMPATRPHLREDPWRTVVQQFVQGIPTFRSQFDEPIPRPAKLDRLRAADFPVLVLVGAQETLHDGALMARRFTEQVPRAQVDLLDNANHLITIDQTVAVCDRLHRFLQTPTEPR